MLNTNDKIIKHKTGLLNLAEALGNVSKACQVMGYSRDTFYRYKQAVITSAIEFPAYGQVRTSNELRKAGVFISPSGVRSIWLRHDLENFKNRLKALEEKVANDNGLILTQAQVQALEKKKHDDEACGEIETHHPVARQAIAQQMPRGRLSGLTRYLLRRHAKGRGSRLSANLY